jgi:23S rRNA G2445 N2-methylase RlmL
VTTTETLHLPCARGTERCVAKELEGLGATQVTEGRGVVRAEGPIDLIARANMFSRCASRVLVEIAKLDNIATESDLSDALSRIPFEERLDDKGTFAVEAHLVNAALTHAHYAALKVKDAIVDRFRAQNRARPNVDTFAPSLKFVLYWNARTVTLSLDTSGEALHQRGYRRGVEGVAPMKETLAASILALAHADTSRPFLDPVCGTGTLVVEQVWRALGRAPGRDRRFGFERWRDRPRELDRALALARVEAKDNEKRTLEVPVHASDWHRDAIDAATQCFEQAGIAQLVKLERVDARKAEMPGERPVIVGNLPFGERLAAGSENRLQLEGFYRSLGERFRACVGARVILFSSHPRTAELLALEPSAHVTRQWPLRSGDLEAQLLRYDIKIPGFESKKKPAAS